MPTTAAKAAPTDLLRTLPGDDVRQIMWRFADRYDLQMLVQAVRQVARVDGSVVTVDLAETGIEGANKFIAYDLFPEAAYTVVVTRDPKRSKVSVGSNPWARPPRAHDISKLCERYGGGGHPVVGAVSLDGDRLADARRIAGEIAAALREEPKGP